MRRMVLVVVTLVVYLVTVSGISYAADQGLLNKLFALFGLKAQVSGSVSADGNATLDLSKGDVGPLPTGGGLDPIPDPPWPPDTTKNDPPPQT